jgi:hypothetical protein
VPVLLFFTSCFFSESLITYVTTFDV